jgi:DNA repair protein RecO (recombination protein O)
VESLSTEGFVLRTRPFGESDVIAVLFTSDYGKLSGIARGARRSRRRFAGPVLEPFQEIGLRFARRPHSELAFLHECSIVRSHHHIADELMSFAWASYVCELTERMVPERDPAPELYALFRETMETLGSGVDAESAAHHFILGLLGVAGWGPDFTRCGICDKEVTSASRPILDGRGSGVVCSRHEAERLGVNPEDPSYRPTRRIITEPLLAYVRSASTAVAADSDPRLRAEATQLLDRLIDLHLAKPLKSRRFLAEIRSSERPPSV